jgi:L-iditol 2-dehydrogenase
LDPIAMIGLAKLASGPGHLALARRPEPSAGAGEVVVAVHAAGICGTDLHIEAGEYRSFPPVTLGHELEGEVIAAGDDVDPGWLGARVTSETFFSICGACAPCRDGRPNLCLERRSIGTHVDGAFAPAVAVPARGLHRLPATLARQAGALAEPLACVCQCLLDPSRVAPGDDVIVIGPGPIGLLAAQVARALGGHVEVRGLPADSVRLTAARDLGFEVSSERPAPESADVVIECSGSEGGAAAALAAVRRIGRYVQVGIFGRPVTLGLDAVLYKEVAVSSGFASTPRSWRRAVALLERGEIALTPLITRVSPLAEWEPAFADLRAGRALKIVFDPRMI